MTSGGEGDHQIEQERSGEVRPLVDHLFRHQAARIVATLTRIFGIRYHHLAEDVVQETLLTALRRWSYQGVPENPAAWIQRVARNRALDVLRRNATFQKKQPEITASENHRLPAIEEIEIGFESEIVDDQLRLMFACCHPGISSDSRVALTLKLLCSFSIAEIASAFLVAESTVSQRIVRARRQFKSGQIVLDLPPPSELPVRLGSVLGAIYLLYNEGYKAHVGENLVRHELCAEAIRLCSLLCEHAIGDRPHVHALLAMMLLQSSRFPARTDANGGPILLADQDRQKWDRRCINLGLTHLEAASRGTELSEYHLQAGVAACHATADSWQETDWREITEQYDRLVAMTDSPVHWLNRAVARSMLDGPESAIGELDSLADRPGMKTYYLYHATRGELLLRLKRHVEAAACYERAVMLTGSEPEKRFFRGKVDTCKSTQK